MFTNSEQNIEVPNPLPSAGAAGEVVPANAAAPIAAPPSRNASRPSLGWTITDCNPSHDPLDTGLSNLPPRWQMVEYRHKDCDKCHAFIAFDGRFTTDMNKHYEKVVELAINTMNVFHEMSPRVENVDVSRRFEKETSRLVVEVTASTAT